MEEGKRWKDLISFLSSLRGDLANVAAPPSFQAPSSAVELPICWSQRPCLFIAPTLESDPLKRHLRVLEWVIHAFRAQYYLGLDDKGSARKPLNAFLGELFLAQWTDEAGTVKLTSEQVSHHPPITAAYISNEEHGITASGYTRVEMSFTGSFNVKQTGHIMLHLREHSESYLLPFPSCKMKGFLARKLYPEVSGTHHIVSKDFISELTFSGEGFLSDSSKRNRFSAKIFRADDPSKSPLYTISGQWNKEWTVTNCKDKSDAVTHLVDDPPPAAIQISSEAEQSPWESRRAWGKVIDGIRKGDIWKLIREKTRLEEAQRAMRRKEQAEGKGWEQKFFSSREVDPVFDELAGKVGLKSYAERTKGVWRYDEVKAKGVRWPYREGSPFEDEAKEGK